MRKCVVLCVHTVPLGTIQTIIWFPWEAHSSSADLWSSCVSATGTSASEWWDLWCVWLRVYVLITTPSGLYVTPAAHTWTQTAGEHADTLTVHVPKTYSFRFFCTCVIKTGSSVSSNPCTEPSLLNRNYTKLMLGIYIKIKILRDIIGSCDLYKGYWIRALLDQSMSKSLYPLSGGLLQTAHQSHQLYVSRCY